jgi:NAD(P)-dependent dehydrogenase (short-subunit alcohol dehydrogenase family)
VPGFDGKVAVVTGGSSGIGRASALAFAREGARVVIADVNGEGSAETVRMIAEAGGAARFIHIDVSRAADVAAMVAFTVEAFGRLDYALNNAAINVPPAPVTEMPEESWDRIIAVNLKGIWLCLKYEVAQMLRQGGGAIVNVASVQAMGGGRNTAAYAASKHGIIGLTKSVALETARQGIRVNAVCPATIRTPMYERITGGGPEVEAQQAAAHPIGRIGEPEEVAAAVIWLCSDAASFTTGHALAVDGGDLAT